jgi:potassium-dependent mechanosensitive channel
MAQEIPLEEIQKGVQAVTWPRGIASAGVLVGSILVARLAGHFVRWAFSKEVRGPAFAFSKLLTYALTFAGAVAALGLLGLPLSSLVLTSSALLVGVGFSLQHVARDLVAGVVILVEQSIRKNDFVSFAGTTGTVQEIGLRATQLLTRDGTVLVVPNDLLVTTEVTNHSHPFQPSRVRVEIPADLGESADDVRAAIASAAARHPEVVSEPPPMVHLDAIDPVGFRFLLVAWVKDAVTVPRIASELRFAAARAFAERGIRFPVTTVALSPPTPSERDTDGTERIGPPHEH